MNVKTPKAFLVLVLLLAIGSASYVLLDSPAQANAVDAEITARTDPATWMPNYIVTGASNQNDNNGGHDIWYWFNFSRTSGMSSPFWTGDAPRGTIELGWKDTGHTACNSSGNVLKRGWHSNARVAVDPTEDDTDAIIWISDLSALRADQLADPSKEYFIAYDCNPGGTGNDNFRNVREQPILEAQLGLSLIHI